ncbi:unnamed protein product [Ceutorhynchus assimilis]|uniref:Uncharacterized protein n=1 Tax=Ceutorhynchus assimilis TaxID=467358 RepID=A0A9N9MTL0_9CUCU|nr:unnamed protein product [Ceutorhynchus assimilis]
MPSFVKKDEDVSKEVTRKLAQRVVSTLKRIGASKKITLKNVQQYIREEYPKTPQKLARLNNELEKALSSGVGQRTSNNYRKPQTVTSLIMEARRRRRRRRHTGRKGRRGRKGRSRSRRRGRSHSRSRK